MAATALAPSRTARNGSRSGLTVSAPRKRKNGARDMVQYASCRAHGHEWHHLGLAQATDPVPFHAHGSLGWVSTCSECGTRRTRWITRSGQIATHPTYTYPEGYSRSGDDVLSLQEWRATWIRSALGDL